MHTLVVIVLEFLPLPLPVLQDFAKALFLFLGAEFLPFVLPPKAHFVHLCFEVWHVIN
jgi:hypothetical protein